MAEASSSSSAAAQTASQVEPPIAHQTTQVFRAPEGRSAPESGSQPSTNPTETGTGEDDGKSLAALYFLVILRRLIQRTLLTRTHTHDRRRSSSFRYIITQVQATEQSAIGATSDKRRREEDGREAKDGEVAAGEKEEVDGQTPNEDADV